MIEVFFFGSSLFSFSYHILLLAEHGLLFLLLDSLLVSSLLLSFYTSILSLRHMKVWGGVTIESKLATLFHYRTTFLLDC